MDPRTAATDGAVGALGHRLVDSHHPFILRG
jgi:hypothetical protein